MARDIDDLRQSVIEALDREPVDLLAQVSQGHLRMAWNDLAPESMAIAGREVSLEVRSEGSVFTARDVAIMSERFARAVASIGHEIAHPSQGGQLTSADYARAPIYTAHTPSGMIVFTPGVGAPVGEGNAPSLAQQSMIRLAQLLPESPDDPQVANRVLSLRDRSARAVSEVAEAAKRARGLTVELVGAEKTHSVVTLDQAENIEDLLSDTTESVVRQSYKGHLDGTRVRRRLFYLVYGDDEELTGSIDEEMVPKIKRLLDQDVVVEVDKVIRTSRSGRTSRASYRLVSVAQQPPLPT
ncbi:hypothetical protein KMZ32_05955 [Phycicoccus sp. MAQZ13P-2]|uniref:hypothetical protein n=1 Tax=Phycicoccus mangrovi TaxID=2840470 RepID=UPI001C000C29|nr:hypothetical protein [Phycicoccus mangrovi]MBT9273617.1 hypothetical protein [Phycicoccus mangrovi]